MPRAVAILAVLAFGCAHSTPPRARADVEVRQKTDAVTSDDARLHVDWQLYPVGGDGGFDRTVELVVRAGATQGRFRVRTTGFGYSFLLSSQCEPRAAGRIAELWLNGGGNRAYALERRGNGRMAFVERVSSDGVCGDAGDQPCPEHVNEIAVIDGVSGDGPVVERYISIDESGTQTVEQCRAP